MSYKIIEAFPRVFIINYNPISITPNVILFSGQKYSLLVDPSNDIEQVNLLTSFIIENNLPSIKYVTATHFHMDHIQNIGLFKESTIISSKYMAKYIKLKTIVIEAPFIIDLGGKKVEISYLPSSHSKGSLMVYDNDNEFLILGDALYGKKGTFYKNFDQSMLNIICKTHAKNFILGHDTYSKNNSKRIKLFIEGLKNRFNNNETTIFDELHLL